MKRISSSTWDIIEVKKTKLEPNASLQQQTPEGKLSQIKKEETAKNIKKEEPSSPRKQRQSRNVNKKSLESKSSNVKKTKLEPNASLQQQTPEGKLSQIKKEETAKNIKKEEPFSPRKQPQTLNVNKKSLESKSSNGSAKAKPKQAIKKEKGAKKTNEPLVSEISKENKQLKLLHLVAQCTDLTESIISTVVSLFESEMTIPFIVRYRKHLIGHLSADDLHRIKETTASILTVLDKAEKLKKKLDGLGYLDGALSSAIDACKTTQELDYLNEPYKVLKSSKLRKVIDLGLSAPASQILQGTHFVNLNNFVTNNLNIKEILELVTYFMADIMSKDCEFLAQVHTLEMSEPIYLEVKKNDKSDSKGAIKKGSEVKFESYYNFRQNTSRLKPHQVLAINRGEALKCLKVKMDVAGSFHDKLNNFVHNKWLRRGHQYKERTEIFNKACDYLYSKRVLPHVKTVIRNELSRKGEKASIDVFASNLKYFLLVPPVHSTVCAIDPGYVNGCKLAVLNAQQEILTTDILYINNPSHFINWDCTLVKIIEKYSVELIAVGNGMACRDVESHISQLVTNRFLSNRCRYAVVSEAGVSVYSVSSDALSEYPNVSPNIISAISLAKRLQDPLCELVKMDPKHLGVGMYQHDVNDKKLQRRLDEVVSECVSDVGVDLNKATLRILRRVSGLTDSKAKMIIQEREKKVFIKREDLLKIKGIGPKTFQQCAGFVKIFPDTLPIMSGNKLLMDPLDQTIIHPEEYKTALSIVKMSYLSINKIGTAEFIKKMELFRRQSDMNVLADNLKVPYETLDLILDVFTKPLNYDLRLEHSTPLFRRTAKSAQTLKIETEVIGQISNVTHFGAFVDIGIEFSGFIPFHYLPPEKLHLGHIVVVKVMDIQINRRRVTLQFRRFLKPNDPLLQHGN